MTGAIPDDRRGLRRHFEIASARIRLEHAGAIGANHFELVGIALAEIGDEDFPVAAGPDRPHRVDAAVPGVEVADHADPPRIRRPHREVHAGADAVRDRVRAEFIERLEVRAFAEQMNIEVGQHRTVAIGVIDLDRHPFRPQKPQAVIERCARRGRNDGFEEALAMNHFERGRLRIAGTTQLDGAGIGAKDTNGEAGGGVVRTEHRERIGMHTAGDRVQSARVSIVAMGVWYIATIL